MKNENAEFVKTDRHLAGRVDKALRNAHILGMNEVGDGVVVDLGATGYYIVVRGRVVATDLTHSQAHSRIVKLLSK